MKISDVTSALTHKDVTALKELFDQPIPLAQAKQIIGQFIVDQDLFAIIDNELDVNGDKDARPLIITWLKQNLPELFKQPFERAPGFESPITSHPDIKGE